DPGGIEKWLRLGEGVGLRRDDLGSEKLLLPSTRYAVDAYLNFVATRPWIEGVASSLTELFAPELMTRRLGAFEKHYTWIDPEAVLVLNESGAAIVKHCDGRSTDKLLAALSDLFADGLQAADVHAFLGRLSEKGLLRDAADSTT